MISLLNLVCPVSGRREEVELHPDDGVFVEIAAAEVAKMTDARPGWGKITIEICDHNPDYDEVLGYRDANMAAFEAGLPAARAAGKLTEDVAEQLRWRAQKQTETEYPLPAETVVARCVFHVHSEAIQATIMALKDVGFPFADDVEEGEPTEPQADQTEEPAAETGDVPA